MSEQIIFYKRGTTTEVIDPFYRDSKWIGGVTIGSQWGVGHAKLGGTIHRDVLREIQHAGGDRVVVKLGERVLYDGELQDPIRDLGGQQLPVSALGWINTLKTNALRRRWVDDNAILRLDWPRNSGLYTLSAQERGTIVKRGHFFRWSPVTIEESITPTTALHIEEYTAPANNPILRVTASLRLQSGEGLRLRLFDGGSNLQYTWATSGSATTSMDVTLSPGTSNIIRFYFDPTASDLYDQNDWMEMYNLTVYLDTEFTQGPMVERVLELCGESISTDYGLIVDPGLTLSPYQTRNDGFQSALSVIKDILAFGDSSQNRYEFMVWDGQNSSDGLPQGEVRAYSVSDYEWALDPHDEGTRAKITSASRDQLFNSIAVRYVDEFNATTYLTWYDDSSLQDTTSVGKYGTRVLPLDIGPADDTLALAIGESALAAYKDPRPKASFTAQIARSKTNARVSASNIRAGDRVRWGPTGDIFFIGEVSYSLDGRTAQLSTELPADRLSTFLAQRKYGMENTWPVQAGYLAG